MTADRSRSMRRRSRAQIALAIVAAWVLLLPATSGHTQLPANDNQSPSRAAPASDAPAAIDSAIELPERQSSSGRARNLFAAHSWRQPAPPPPPRPPPPPPSAPPLPFSYMGSFEQGDVTVYFLARGDRAYDVKIGDVLDGSYSLDAVTDNALLFTYLPLQQKQSLPLAEKK